MSAVRLALLFVCTCLAACQTTRHVPQVSDLAITNVTVIDPENRSVLPRRTIYVARGKIVAVLPAEQHSAFTSARVIDGTGKYVIPGLIDMHVHLFLPEPATPTLNLLLANGVTGIREMSSDCWAAAGAKKGCIEDYRNLQSAIRSWHIAGPDLLGLTSTMVMGPTRLKLSPTSPAYITPVNTDQARTLVQHLTGRGVDLIKTHDSIPTAAFFAMMDEANRLGIAVGGHVPFGAGSVGAARRGYRSIEHARDLLYDCSRYGPEYRRREAAFSDGAAGVTRPTNLERVRRTVTEFDETQCATLFTQLIATGVYYVPTHVTREMEALADEANYRADPTRKYILPARRKNWESDLEQTAALPLEERSALDRFFEHGLRITGLAHKAGIPIMAGTDTSDTMIVPGFSLHRELGLLHRAGLATMDVLRSATTVPAQYLNRRDLGGISAGKQADLVLLRSNPLHDIRNSTAVEVVVKSGRVFARKDLDQLLTEAERLAQNSGS